MEAKSHSKSKKTIGDEPPSLQKTKEYENKIKIAVASRSNPSEILNLEVS